MTLTIARMIVSVILFCLPIVIFIVLSGKPDNWLFILFPMFGAVPAIIAALVLFVPIEILLDSRGLGWAKNFAVPLAGAAIVFLFTLVMGVIWGNLELLLSRLASGGIGVWGVYFLWSALGAVWGLVWRSTEWLAKTTGMVNG